MRRNALISGRSPRLDIRALAREAIDQAAAQPHRRSEILGTTAMQFAGLARDHQHVREAPMLRKLAAHFGAAAMVPEQPATVDDFEEQLVEQFQAVQEGYQGDLNQIARADAIHDQKQALLTPRVCIAPGSWGQGATLGRSGTFKFNPSQEDIRQGIAQSGTLAFWQGEPYEAQAITVDVNLLEYLGNPSGTDTGAAGPAPPEAHPFATVVYGSDGNVAEVKFDIGRGTRFTVVGSYVSVLCGMDPVTATSAQMTVGASIGAFAAPSTAPVFLTTYQALAIDEESSPIKIPAHAVQLFPILTSVSPPAGLVRLNFFPVGGAGGVPLAVLDFPVGTVNASPIPIPGDIGYMTIQNLTGIPARFRLPFQLSM